MGLSEEQINCQKCEWDEKYLLDGKHSFPSAWKSIIHYPGFVSFPWTPTSKNEQIFYCEQCQALWYVHYDSREECYDTVERLNSSALPVIGSRATPDLILAYLFSDQAQDPILGICRDYFQQGAYARYEAVLSILTAFRQPDLTYSHVIWLLKFFHQILLRSKRLRIDSIQPLLAAGHRQDLLDANLQFRQSQEAELKTWYAYLADHGLSSDNPILLIPEHEQRALLQMSEGPGRIRKAYSILEDNMNVDGGLRLIVVQGVLRRIQTLPFAGEPIYEKERKVLVQLLKILNRACPESDDLKTLVSSIGKLLERGGYDVGKAMDEWTLHDDFLEKSTHIQWDEDLRRRDEQHLGQKNRQEVFAAGGQKEDDEGSKKRLTQEHIAGTKVKQGLRQTRFPSDNATTSCADLISVFFSHYLLFIPGMVLSLVWIILIRSYVPLLFLIHIPTGSLMAAASISLGIMDNYYGLLYCKRSNIYFCGLSLFVVPLTLIGGLMLAWIILTGGRSSPFLIPAFIIWGLLVIISLMKLWPVFFDAYIFQDDIDQRAWFDDRKFAFGMPRWFPDFKSAWRMTATSGSFLGVTLPVFFFGAVNLVLGGFILFYFPNHNGLTMTLTGFLCGLFLPFFALFGVDRVRTLRYRVEMGTFQKKLGSDYPMDSYVS